MKDFESVDPFLNDEVLNDPYEYFEAARSRCPVQREDHHGVMVVTGYHEVVEIAQDDDRFSACNTVTGPFPGFPVPLEGDDVTEQIEKHRDELPFTDQLPCLDPPVHTDHRELMMRLITPKRLKENEDLMWQLADGLIDELLADGKGEFINGFAVPYTLLVIADLLGVPPEDRDDFASKMARRDNVGGGIGGKEAMAHNPLEFLYNAFVSYIEQRRANPQNDVLTGLAQATFPDGSEPSPMDVARVASNVYSAGQETTVRLLGSALRILAENPEFQRELRENPDRISNFIEETLRRESPIKGDFRLSKVSTEVGGVPVPAGTTVMLAYGAANRDPRLFDDPATFDPGRKNARRHIAFGRGIHTCPGAPLARAEAKVVLSRLLARTSDIRLDEDKHGPEGNRSFRYLPTYILRGLVSLHLEFTPAEEGR